MSLPDEFYLPRPQDFCRGDFTKGNVRVKHCFVGWQRELLPFPTIWIISSPEDEEERKRFFTTAVKVARRLKLKNKNKNEDPISPYYDGNTGSCFDYNDDPRNTNEQLAEWFEETVKELGYDVE